MHSPFDDVSPAEAKTLAARLRAEAHHRRPAFSPALHERLHRAVGAESRSARRFAAIWPTAAAAALAAALAWPLATDRGVTTSAPAVPTAGAKSATPIALDSASAAWEQVARRQIALVDVRPQLVRLTNPADIIASDVRRIQAAVLNRLPLDMNLLAADNAG